MIQEMLIILLLATAFPAGLLIAYYAKDELVAGRKYFKLIFIISILLAPALFLIGILNSNSMATQSLVLFYLSFLSIISYAKSYNKKFIK